MADLQRTVYPNKWSPVNYRSSAGQGKFAGERPTFYHCATQPTNVQIEISPVAAVCASVCRSSSMLLSNTRSHCVHSTPPPGRLGRFISRYFLSHNTTTIIVIISNSNTIQIFTGADVNTEKFQFSANDYIIFAFLNPLK